MKTQFQYTVLLHETDKDGVYVDSKVIIEPKFELAKTEKDLVFKITREIPNEFVSEPDKVQILIRNF